MVGFLLFALLRQGRLMRVIIVEDELLLSLALEDLLIGNVMPYLV
jgi:hypothetical protein